ncbi:ankyrin repeat domain-containing protein [Chryseobacterium sp. ERMR1:04]|uniref:ankyrin repeat domain-containing protein n=1 Tax=Chryseobacterium sp. ERMR1:04 TaxID=1705393 RepID=UPI0006C8A624|nr:ankyrin repeat domain-containing protein [Chryseobacterium sp. ERMR1:04]KPH13380.1 hypothetical protein AMQ68_13135 [Chryseobacterium sp. ERMR1:04]
MKKLFSAIRKKEINEVSSILDNKPESVNCIAKGISKRDDGEIPLQTAIKTENFDIAKLLIERGANVKFMETQIEDEEWRKPVLHYAIEAVIANSRDVIYTPKYSPQNNSGFVGLFKKDQWTVKSEPTKKYQEAFEILKLLIEKGAEIHSTNMTNNYQISAVEFICNRIENYQFDHKRPLVKETLDDLNPIFKLFKITKSTDFDILISSAKGNTVYKRYKNIIDQFFR